jgi:hypothetical protein
MLRDPLGIVRQDLHPYLSPYAVRAAHHTYDDIRRLRVLFLS